MRNPSPRSISRNKAESGRQRFVGSLSDSGIRRTRNGKSFGKYAQTVITDDVNYRGPSDKAKIERLRHEKINADSYTKRTAGRVAATPALQNKPVGLPSCTTQAHARRPLEYPHLAVASAYGTRARTPFAPRTSSDTPAPILNLLPRPIAMSHPIHTYTELQQQIHDDLRIQHPEWIAPSGESRMCDSHDACLTEMLDTLTRRGSNRPIVLPHRALEPAVTGN